MSSLSAGEATGPSEDRATIAARAAVVAAFGLLIAVAWLTQSSLTRLDTTNQQRAMFEETLREANLLLRDLTDSQRGMRGFILSHRTEAMGVYRQAIADMPARVNAISRLVTQGAQEPAVLSRLRDDVDAIVAYSHALLNTSDLSRQIEMESSGQGLAVMDRALADLQTLLDSAQAELLKNMNAAQEHFWSSKLLSVLGSCVAVCILVPVAAANLRQTFRRRKAEEYLHATEEPYRSLVDAIEDYALFMLDPQGKVISWNTGAQRLKGYSASEIVGQHFSCFYTQKDRDNGHPQGELAVALRDGRYAEEGMRVRKDGSLFHAHVVITAVRDHAGNLMGFAKAEQDLTHARAMDMAMREQAQILDLVNETIFVRDAADRIRYWNKGAEHAYGWSREEAIGQVSHALLKTQFSEPLERILGTLRTDGQWTGELKHVRRDGSVLHLSSNWVRHLAGSDEEPRIIETNYDLTELKAMEQTLREKNAELEAAARVKDRFLANMSHELRTPLNAIIGFCQLMEDALPGPINATQASYLSDVLSSARHLLQLINDLLDLSKIAAGKMELLPELFALAAAINEVCSGMQPLADIKSIKVKQRLENAPKQACLDTGRFKQILYNLLSNAIKFTPERGTVSVEVDTPKEGVFALKVRDTGIGIAPENMKRLFKEFEQLDDSTTRRHQSTGLGLALTRNLVELHGGTIRAESQPGQGSTFTVTLPDAPVWAAAVS